MALDDKDKAEIAAIVAEAMKSAGEETKRLVNGAITARMERYEEKLRTAAPAPVEAEPEKAKTVKDELEAIKAELRKAKEETAREKAAAVAAREDSEFKGTWSAGLEGGKTKFKPHLAGDHLASLRLGNRIFTDQGGVVRVKDPALSEYDTHPTVGEYLGKLAKSEPGKDYLAPTGAGGASHAKGAPKNGAAPEAMTEDQAFRSLLGAAQAAGGQAFGGGGEE